MYLKIFKAVTNSSRHKITIQKSLLSKNNRFIKNLFKGVKCFSGRSSTNGRITVRHKGGGSKKLYRKIEGVSLTHMVGLVLATFYDPFRTSFISLVFNYVTKGFLYILATNNVGPGSIVHQLDTQDLRLGCQLFISQIPAGSLVHSLALNKKKITFIKSAGTFGQILQKSLTNTLIRLPSSVTLKISDSSIMTLGTVSNPLHSSTVIGSAGKNRRLGKRPCVRGIAMNPVDHPHGGRTNGGRPSVTPWGIPTKGKPTVKKR